MSPSRRLLRSISRRSLDFHENLASNVSSRQGAIVLHNVVFGCVRQPCRGLASLMSASPCGLQLASIPRSCLCDAHSAVEWLDSCKGLKPSDPQEINSIATLSLKENSQTSMESASISGNGSSRLQQDMPEAIEEDRDLRVLKRVDETAHPDHDLESSMSVRDGEENAESSLHLDDVTRLSKRVESPRDAKIIQDICNLLERKGWQSSTEAFLNKHYTLQLPHSIVANVILKLKILSLAKLFFEWACRHSGHDLLSCHALLLKLGEKKLFNEMWELLNRMRDNNCQINKTTVCIMVKAYGAAGMPDMAVDVFKKINNYGVTAGTHVFTMLLSVFFKLRLLDDARLCYRKMLVDAVKLDTCSYSTLIRGFGMMGCIRDAQTCFDVMLKEGFEPDLSTFNSLIEGFCCTNAMQKALSTFSGLQKKGLKPNVYTFNMLIKAFCKAGKLEDAVKLYKRIEKVCLPNQATFNILLQGLLANGEVSKAIAFFQEMEKEGWVDARSYVFLSNGLREMKQTEEMLDLLRSLFAIHGFANIEVCNTLIYNLSNLNQLEKAENLFKGMTTALESPSIPTYAIMISSYCRAEKLQEALELLKELKARGCQPSAFCYIPIISLMLKRDKLVDALKWVEEMLELDLEVTSVTCELLLTKLCRKGMAEQAMRFSDYIMDKRFTISVNTLFELMKCLCKLLGVEVADARFRTMYKQQGLPKCKAVLQALAVMDEMAPMCDEK